MVSWNMFTHVVVESCTVLGLSKANNLGSNSDVSIIKLLEASAFTIASRFWSSNILIKPKLQFRRFSFSEAKAGVSFGIWPEFQVPSSSRLASWTNLLWRLLFVTVRAVVAPVAKASKTTSYCWYNNNNSQDYENCPKWSIWVGRRGNCWRLPCYSVWIYQTGLLRLLQRRRRHGLVVVWFREENKRWCLMDLLVVISFCSSCSLSADKGRLWPKLMNQARIMLLLVSVRRGNVF